MIKKLSFLIGLFLFGILFSQKKEQLQKQNEKCPNSDTLAVSANKRLYHREGKVIGKLQQTAKKTVIELDNQALTEQQQQQLEQFLGELLG